MPRIQTARDVGGDRQFYDEAITTLTTCLWFDGNAEDAVAHYLSIFPNSTNLSQSSEEPTEGQKDSEGTQQAEKETPLTVSFELDGRPFMALNGGPEFPFTPAISFVVNCQTQEQVDYYWDRLLDGGSPAQCGWLTDKFGVSWQIVPDRLGELMSDPDPERSARVMQAMLKMIKLDIAGLEAAAAEN